MNPSRQPPPLEPEGLGDPAVITVDATGPAPIRVDFLRASPNQRHELAPYMHFLRSLPKAPTPERIIITVTAPALLGLLLEGRLSLRNLDLVERIVAIHVLFRENRWAEPGPVAAWAAMYRKRLRARVRAACRARARRASTTC
jgi:hypothetical protein